MTNQKILNDCNHNKERLTEWERDKFLPYVQMRIRDKKRRLTPNETAKLNEIWMKANKETK